jgi:ATP-dependent helicase/nuclease subunit B
VYHGLSLQLLTNLLAIEATATAGGAGQLKAAAAFYLQMARAAGDVDHPSEALDPSDPGYLLRMKPRGVFDGTFVGALDASLEPGFTSDVVQVRINKDGGFGRRGSDAAAPQEFRALLEHVRKRLGGLADGILSGQISITPYRLNRRTPCPQCEYRAVCRFDASINRYHNLAPLGRQQVLDQITPRGEDDAPQA